MEHVANGVCAEGVDSFLEDRPLGAIPLNSGATIAYDDLIRWCCCAPEAAESIDTEGLCKLIRLACPTEIVDVARRIQAQDPGVLEMLSQRLPTIRGSQYTATPAWGAPCECNGKACLDVLMALFPVIAVFEAKAGGPDGILKRRR